MIRRRIFLPLLVLVTISHLSADELILAGGDEVFIVDAAEAESGVVKKRWRWSGQEAAGIPEEARREFHHLDECKPIGGGTKLLVCASNGGCVLIERASGRVLWRARSRNAHSLDLLPRDRIVVASSLSGDHVEVFDLADSAIPVFKTPLHSAHGVVWDEVRNCLWALGFDELRRYTLANWDTDTPSLTLVQSYPLPDPDGHDLRPLPASSDLILTTGSGVFLFDRDQAGFRPHPLLAKAAKVKSIDVHPVSGRVVVSAWGNTLKLLEPAGTITFEDARPYKARWVY